jgi:cohesin loading factor subunit SCC2
MANPETVNQNGITPYYEQAQYIDPSALQQQNNQTQSSARPFTLDEALPYTPFTSVFPFESGQCDWPYLRAFPANILIPICLNMLPSLDKQELSKPHADSLNPGK